MGGMMPGLGRLQWPWSSAGCSTPYGGIGGAALKRGWEDWAASCLSILGGSGGDLATVLLVVTVVRHQEWWIGSDAVRVTGDITLISISNTSCARSNHANFYR